MKGKNFVIKNCPCYDNKKNTQMNCQAETLGYNCQDNNDCPLRVTFIETLSEIFDTEWIED